MTRNTQYYYMYIKNNKYLMPKMPLYTQQQQFYYSYTLTLKRKLK